MNDDICATKLTTCRVSSDGTAVSLGFIDNAGRFGALELPIDCLSSLNMTLPKLAAVALQVRPHDSSLRITYPLERFRVEAMAGTPPSAILTLAAPDGFEVSFSVRPEKIAALHTAIGPDALIAVRLQ